MKDASRLTAAEVNQRLSKSASVAVRKLQLNGGDWHVFSDLKVLHVAITHCMK